MKKILALQKLTTAQPMAVADSTSSVECATTNADGGVNSNCSVRCGA